MRLHPTSEFFLTQSSVLVTQSRSLSFLHHSKFLVRYSAGFRSRLQRDSLL